MEINVYLLRDQIITSIFNFPPRPRSITSYKVFRVMFSPSFSTFEMKVHFLSILLGSSAWTIYFFSLTLRILNPIRRASSSRSFSKSSLNISLLLRIVLYANIRNTTCLFSSHNFITSSNGSFFARSGSIFNCFFKLPKISSRPKVGG